MPIGNEMVWGIVALFVLVVVIILGIIFKPFGEFLVGTVPLVNNDFPKTPGGHSSVMHSQSVLAKSSLESDNAHAVGVKAGKDDIMDKIEKEESGYGHLDHAGKPLTSVSYVDVARGRSLAINNSTMPAGAYVNASHGLTHNSKNLTYHSDIENQAAHRAVGGGDADAYESLATGSDFTSPYSMGKHNFVKAHGHIHDKKWSDDAMKAVHGSNVASHISETPSKK